MKDLKVIVQRMIDAGEPEDKIRETVRLYKERQSSGNQTGSSVDATAKPKTAASNQEVVQPQNNQEKNTELESETGSLDLTKDKTTFVDPLEFYSSNVKQTKGSDLPELDNTNDSYDNLSFQSDATSVVNNIVDLKEIDNARINLDRDKPVLESYLKASYFDNPNAIREITGTNSLLGYRNEDPDLQDFKKHVKNSIGPEGIRKSFPGISDSNVDNILVDMFNTNANQEEEDNSKRSQQVAVKQALSTGLSIDKAVDELNIADINTHKNKEEVQLALINSKLKNKTLPPSERKDLMLKADGLASSLFTEKGGASVNYDRFFDPKSGRAVGVEEAEVIKTSGGDVVNMSGPYETYLNKFKGSTYDKLEGFNNQVLLEEQGYASQSEELGDYYVGDKVIRMGLKEAGFEPNDKGVFNDVPLSVLTKYSEVPDKSNLLYGNVRFSKGEVVPQNYEGKSYSNEDEFVDFLQNRRRQNIDIAAKKEALWQTYHLNRDIRNIKKGRIGQVLGSAAETLFGPVYTAENFPKSNQQLLDAFADEVVPSSGIVMTDEDKGIKGELNEDQVRHLERDISDKAYESGGALLGLSPYLLGLNKGQAVLGVNRVISGLKGARYIINGRNLSSTRAINIAASKGKDLNSMIKAGTATKVAANNWQKGKALALTAFAEEVKMSKGLDALSGDRLGFETGVGAGFALGGKLLPYSLKNLTKYNQLNTALELTLKNGPAFAIAAEAGEAINAIVDDVQGREEFKTFYKKHWGDYDENFERTVLHLMTGSGLGMHGLKKNDIRTYDGIRNFKLESHAKTVEALANIENGTDVAKNTEKLKNYQQDYLMAESYLDKANDIEAWTDPVKGKKLYDQYYEPLKQEFKKAGKELLVEVGDKPIYQEFVDSNGKVQKQEVNALYTRAEGKTPARVEINTKKSKGRATASHEALHAYMDLLFDGKPQLKLQFENTFKNTLSKIKLEGDTNVYDAILNDPALKGKGRIQLEEMMTYTAEFLSKKENQKMVDSQAYSSIAKVFNNISKSVTGKNADLYTQRELINMLGRYSKTGDISKLKGLDTYVGIGKGLTTTEMASRDLVAEKQSLIAENKDLFQNKPEGWKEKANDNAVKVKELNKNIEISTRNIKNIKRYKEGEAGEPLREAAASELLKDNTPIIETWFNRNFKRGLDVSESDFRSSMMEGVVKIMNSYNNYDVPFGYYLKSRLQPQLGNILRRAQAGRTTDIAMSEMSMTAEELQIADTAPELSRSGSGPEAPKGRELVKDLSIPEEVISKAEERLADLDVTKLTYKTLKDLAPEYTNEILGVEPKSGNLGKQSVTNAQKWFSKDSNARLFIDALPEGTIPMEGAPELVKGTSTGVQNTLLKEFYNAGGRAKTKAGAIVQSKIKGITPRQVKDYFGIKPDGTFVELKNDRSLSQKVKAAVDQIGKAWTNQVVRQSLKNNPKYNISTSLENRLNQIEAGKSQSLASRNLVGEMISKVKDIKWETDTQAGAKFRSFVVENEAYVDFLESTGGLKEFFKGLEVDLKGFDLKTFQEYAKSRRVLDIIDVKPLTPELFPGGYKGQKGKKGVHESLYNYAKQQGIDSKLLNINEAASKRMADPEFSRNFAEKFLPDFINTFDSRLIPSSNRLIRTTMGEGNQRFGYRPTVDKIKDGKKVGERKQIFDADLGKSILSKTEGVNEKLNFNHEYVKAVDNGVFKRKLENDLLPDVMPSTPEGKSKLADKIKKYLSPDGTTKGYNKMLEANEGMMEYTVGKIYDYLSKAKTVSEKAEAINNASYLLQIQTNLGNGIFRGLATHEAVSMNKNSSKHSEHDLQLANFTGNVLMNALQSGSKSKFLNKVKPLIKSYKQSIIEKELQEKFDSNIYGGKAGFDFKYTTDAGKYPWMREQVVAETTLNLKSGKTYDQLLTDVTTGGKAIESLKAREKAKDKVLKKVGLASKNLSPTGKDLLLRTVDKALELGRKKNKKKKGMSTFDFDETLIIDGENFVVARKGNDTAKISSSDWPIKGPEFAQKGYEFDFSDFANVRGGKDGPLLQKMKNQVSKYGPDNVFVLTARQQASAEPIHKWLKEKGIDIPLENITGLGKSEGEAKAEWMLKKFAEGYNDMYFVDDALPNVEAVKKVLDQLDIKSKVQQALASKDLSQGVNDIMKHSLDIAPEKVFSKAEAKIRGAKIKRRKLFMTDGAADFELLLEPLYGKGEKGTKNQKWFGENIIKPFERGYNDLNNAKQRAVNEYMELRKQNKDIVKSLDKEIAGTSFTTDMALRTYIWNKNGVKIPDIAKATEAKLVEYVKNNPKLQAYAENVARLTGIETGLKEPTGDWWAETLAGEVGGLGEGVSRAKYLAEFIESKNEIFSEENLNKMESKLGTNWRRNLEDMLDRMETGRTRSANLGDVGNGIMNYLNGSVGTIMNLNTRSATLQLISSVNFVNHSFNNPLAATRAFANQPQYWKDFMTIMNSDMLKQRRAGLQINVTEAELAAAASKSKNPAKAVLAKILKAGYAPTKIADSFAIASGGATYYRNAIRKYVKEGLSKAEAQKKAFVDFQAIAERTQQSSRPDLLSSQQVSVAGRIILPFANTPMQMNRIMMKDLLDIKNGRYKGVVGENSITNKMSKVAYYGFVQSAIFAGLQSGLYALTAFGDDEKLKQEKKVYAINTMADSFLRGMGIQGAVMSSIKNAILEFQKQNNKGWGADYSEVGEDLLNTSPTIGSKFSKLDAAGNTYKFNKKEILKDGLTLDGPAMQGLTMAVEAVGNVPVNRLYRKIENIKAAMDDQNEAYQRILVGLGWSKWDVGIGQREKAEEKAEKETQKELDKKAEKENNRIQKEKDKKDREEARKNRKDGDDLDGDGKKEYRCRAVTKIGKRCKNVTENKSKKCYAHM